MTLPIDMVRCCVAALLIFITAPVATASDCTTTSARAELDGIRSHMTGEAPVKALHLKPGMTKEEIEKGPEMTQLVAILTAIGLAEHAMQAGDKATACTFIDKIKGDQFYEEVLQASK